MSASSLLEGESEHLDKCLTQFMNEQPKISDAAKNLLAELVAVNGLQGEYDVTQILPAIQKILKALKTMPLLDPIAWGRENPQQQSESATQRMDTIMNYKASFILWKQALSKGESPSKLLGKSFLRTVLPQVKSHIEKAGENSETVVYVIREFERSLTCSQPEKDLVWTTNLQESLSIRQEERKKKAAERASAAEEQEQEAKETIADMLHG